MPAKSKKQQRFFGMVRATQKGKLKSPSPEVARTAKNISTDDAKDFAKTKHKGLPMTKEEKQASITKLANLVTNFMLLKNAGVIKEAGKAAPPPSGPLSAVKSPTSSLGGSGLGSVGSKGGLGAMLTGVRGRPSAPAAAAPAMRRTGGAGSEE